MNNPWLDMLARGSEKLGFEFGESMLYRYLLLGKARLGNLQRRKAGMDLGEFAFGSFFERSIRTRDRKLHLAPPEFVEALPEAVKGAAMPSAELPFLLISGARRLASYNSWTHHIEPLAEKLKGNWATLNSDDAVLIGVVEGQRIRVRSEAGEIEIEARLSPDVRRGVVAIHQFWGHVYETGTTTTRRYPGVNVNHLHDDRVRDRFSGMPVYNGTPCSIEPIGGPSTS